MDEIRNEDARLSLRAHQPTPAQLQVERRSRQTRATRALLTLAGFWVLAPLVFFLPPHLPWALGAVLAGILLAYRQWSGEYVVRSFAGSCPRCGSVLAIEPGTKIRLPHPMHCYSCHHEPTLEPV